MSVSRLRPTRYWPSGDQAGELTVLALSAVTGRAFLPSWSAIHTFSIPPRSLANAIHLPSGLNRGCTSYAVPLVMRRASPPAMGSR